MSSKKPSAPAQQAQPAASDYPTEVQLAHALISSKNGHPARRFALADMLRYTSNPLPAGFKPPYRIVRLDGGVSDTDAAKQGALEHEDEFDYEYDAAVATDAVVGAKESSHAHAVEQNIDAPYPLPGSDKYAYGLRATRDIPTDSIITFAGGRWVAFAGDNVKQRQWYDSFGPSTTLVPIDDSLLIKQLNQYVAFYGEFVLMGDYFVVPNGLPSQLEIGEGLQASSESVVGSESAARMNCAHVASPPDLDLSRLRDFIARNNYAAERSDYEKIRDEFESMCVPSCNSVRATYPATMIVSLRSTRPIKSGELIVCRYPLPTLIRMAIMDKSVILSDEVKVNLKSTISRIMEHAVQIKQEAEKESSAGAEGPAAKAKAAPPKRRENSKRPVAEKNTRDSSAHPTVSSATTPARSALSSSKSATRSTTTAEKRLKRSPPSSDGSSSGGSSAEESE